MFHRITTGAGRSGNTAGVQSSVRERTPDCTLSTFQFLVICVTVTLLAPVVGADVPLTLKPPSEVVLCQPVNLTWTGGTPPYRLDVEPFVDNSPNTTANGRKIALDNTWFLWTPDFPAGSILQISIEGSGTASAASVRATELPSSNSSCLNTTSATPTSTLPPNSLSAPVDQPSATPSPAVLTSSGSVLSKGAIAGIAVAATVIGIGLIVLVAWCLLRRRNRGQHLEKGYERTIFDPTKPNAPTSPSVPALGGSSYPNEDHDPFRPTPYLVAQESTTFGESQLRDGAAGRKKHARDLSDPTSTSSAASMSKSLLDARAPTASPPQFGSADDQGAGDRGGGGSGGGRREGGESEDVPRLDAEGATPPARAFRLGSEDRDMGTSGETTLPPPYSAISGVTPGATHYITQSAIAVA